MNRNWSWWPMILIGLGLVLLLQNFGFNIHIGKLWPLILVAIGLGMLFPRAPRGTRAEPPPPVPDDPPALSGDADQG